MPRKTREDPHILLICVIRDVAFTRLSLSSSLLALRITVRIDIFVIYIWEDREERRKCKRRERKSLSKEEGEAKI